MPAADQFAPRSRRRKKFITKQLAPPDLVAVDLNFSGGAVKVLQDFTDDRDLLRSSIDKLGGRIGRGSTRMRRMRGTVEHRRGVRSG